MFRALYPFNSSDPGTLNANVDDLYCGMCVDTSKQWLQVMDDKGTIGYLPNIFLEYCNWAEQKFVLQFLDDGIGNIHRIGAAIGKYTALQQEQLRLLALHRTTVANNFEQFITHLRNNTTTNPQKSKSVKTRQAPPPPKRAHESTSTSELSNQKVPENHMTKSESHVTTSEDHMTKSESHVTTSEDHVTTSKSHATKLEDHVTKAEDHVTSSADEAKAEHRPSSIIKSSPPDIVAAKLTELLRFKTGLSHEKSKVGVTAIIECLLAHNVSVEQFPEICHEVEKDDVQMAGNSELNADIIEMNSIFESITECKDDSQQRSWHLHDDEGFIAGKLTRLLEILTSGNRDVLVSSIRADLDCVHSLVLYYQMETRSHLRAIMLQIFAALCTMSAVFITTLLCSVLTLELVRDFMSTKDDQRLTYSAIVLSMLFSTGEQIPVNYNEFLSEAFVEFIVEKIERCPDLRIVDVCLELLLSFNQHFTDSHDNMVLRQLTKQSEATILTQNFLKLFNEGEDPVRIIDNEEQQSSVLKFATDLYSLNSTAQLLYTNDIKVLIDIIIRQLTDLSDEDKVRTEYLSLMQLILANSDYDDHCHRKQDLIAALNQIEFIEEGTSSQCEMDVRIVKEIRKHL